MCQACDRCREKARQAEFEAWQEAQRWAEIEAETAAAKAAAEEFALSGECWCCGHVGGRIVVGECVYGRPTYAVECLNCTHVETID